MSLVEGISFRHVQKSWQQTVALQNISLDIAHGELVVFVGSSGCGKSTLLRMLVGLELPTQGQIFSNGQRVNGVGKERGIVFQEPRLFPWLSVIENVQLGLAAEKLNRFEKRQRAQKMLERVQLSHVANVLPAELSGGMAQRVAIARGLVAHPQILMLDEPFGALDALTRQTLQQELLQLHKQTGMTTLLVTHDVDEAVTLADRIVVLSPSPGRIREIVTVNQPHPRGRDSASFTTTCQYIRQLITD